MTRRDKRPSTSKSGLETLKSLRTRIVTAPAAQKPTGTPPSRPVPESDADDLDLFRREMRGTRPIDDGGRAELERPRPAPIPRPRTPDAETEIPTQPRNTARPMSDMALFHHSMADVMPLADLNRVDLSGERARASRTSRTRGSLDPLAKPDPDDVRPAIPADPDALGDDVLFQHAMRGTQRLTDENRIELSRPQPRPEPLKRIEDESAALRESMEAPITLEDRLEMGDEAAFLRTGLPRRVLIDLRRGRWTLQGELDLHGFTREEARTALGQFLFASLQRGARCVRVIHGKGLGSPGKISILKQLSRGWLAQREEILAFCQASPNQGGSGALMVLLRGQPAAPRD